MRKKYTVVALFVFAAPFFCMAQAERIETSSDGIFLGDLMLSEHRYPEADACFKKALTLTTRDSSRFRIAAKMLDVYAGLKDLKRMEECHARLMPKMSDKNKTLLNAKYASNLIKLQQLDKALQVIEKSSFSGGMSDDDKTDMYYKTAEVYRSLKRYKKAAKLFLKAGDLASTQNSKASSYGSICYFPVKKELDDYKKKVADWYFKQKGLASYKWLSTNALVAIHNRDKEFDQSIELLTRYLKGDLSHKGQILYNLGTLFERKGEYEQALEYYEKALLDEKLTPYERTAAKRNIKGLRKKVAKLKK